jgi:P-type Cu+ transporter
MGKPMSIAEAAAADRTHVTLPIEGMSCATCVGRVEKALSALPGVQATVNISTERADIEFDRRQLTPVALAQAVEQAGYEFPARRANSPFPG